jgi:trehalose 6-phosphate synthase/phosphatase
MADATSIVEEPEHPDARAGCAATVPLVVVSSRLPVTAHRGARGLEYRRSPGGLVAAIEPALGARGGTWIGWPGLAPRRGERLPRHRAPYTLRPVQLSDAEVRGYHQGFSNRTLWPLFHSLADRARFDRRDFETYAAVNARFASAVTAVATPDALIWIHDYQLMLVAARLRAERPALRLAFFLHIPFPPSDIFRILPWDREILRGILACDLVGFHVESYARNFLDCAERLLGLEVDRERQLVHYDGRSVAVGAFPVGIDFAAVETRARGAPPVRIAHAERVVIGVDRLDYTKGIPERMRAFERLLALHPEHRGRTVLFQIAVPSRANVADYRLLKREIDALVGRVNGRFGTESWTPVRYLHREVPPEQLAALYRDADVAVVTPLRDGMNLVAKEFVASQVATPGVLVLSRLAGVAETMPEAVLVNPCDIDGTAAAIQRALVMPAAERRERLDALRARERRYDVHRWSAAFVAAALAAVPDRRAPTPAEIEDWLGDLPAGAPLELFLDYDGTLTPIRPHPTAAVLSAEMRWALGACADRDDTGVTIVSGRALADVAAMVDLPGIVYAGNHGLEIAGPGLAPFVHPDLPHHRGALAALATELATIAVDGAWVEEKGPTLTFHYRAVPEALQEDLARRVGIIVRAAGFHARAAHAAVEARPPLGWDKGQAILHVLRQRHGPEWSRRVRPVYIGDDDTDEDAFRVLAGLGVTFRVASAGRPTMASHRLHDVDGVRAVLEWIACRPPRPTIDSGSREPAGCV